MKKTLLLTLALLISISITAQKRSVLLRETFDSMSAPLGWITSENASDNWDISTTNYAGGEANELKFNSTPQALGISRIITTPVDLTGISSVTISFRHFFDKKGMSSLIGVATSSNNGQTWSVAWSQTYSETGQYNVIKSVKTPDMNKSNVLFCIYFQGNSTSINSWYFDDLEITTMEAIDAKAQSIDIPNIIPAGENDIVFSLQNTGSETISSFDASFEIDNQTITETFETQLAQFETKQFTFKNTINLTPDIYNAKLEITSVNKQDDNNPINNSSQKNITVALSGTQRLPMIEHFSSSTCGSCVNLDGAMKEFTANNTGKFVYTKYPMNWPGSGDPYYSADGNERKNFYSVGSVPYMAFNGKDHGYKAPTQEELDAIYNSPAFVNIKGSFSVEENNINIIADIMSYVDLNNIKVYISLNEKTTTENVGTNGLTEFHHIMMKMFPDAKGNATQLETGKYQRYEFSYNLENTFVEETDDLEVAVWIQDIDTREIYNSAYLYEYIEHPYPVKNLTLTNSDKLTISWEAPENDNAIGYNLYINNELILENSPELSYSIENADGLYSIEVVALYENDIKSIGVADKIIVGCHAPVNITADFEYLVQNFEFRHKVTLSWDDVDEADSYNIYLNGEKLGETEETSFVTGFNEPGIYVYTLTSMCETAESEHSEPCTVFLDGTSLTENTIINVNIYPNPVKNTLFIKTDENIKGINIYNINGQLTTDYGLHTTDNNLNIDVTNLKSGIYIININTNKGNIVKQFIKN